MARVCAIKLTGYEEYFAKGTAPTEYCDCHIALTFCNATGKELLATENCSEDHLVNKVYMVIRDKDKLPVKEGSTESTETNPPIFDDEFVRDPDILTADEKYTIPEDILENECNCHEIEESTENVTGESDEDVTGESDEESSEE